MWWYYFVMASLYYKETLFLPYVNLCCAVKACVGTTFGRKAISRAQVPIPVKACVATFGRRAQATSACAKKARNKV